MKEFSRHGKGKYFLIAGIGHCGTGWLTSALNHPDNGIVCCHEKKRELTGISIKELSTLEIEYSLKQLWNLYTNYWALVVSHLDHFRAYGDSNAWLISKIPEVNKIVKIEKIFFIIRNGIPNVNSTSRHARNIYTPKAYNVRNKIIRHYWDLVGKAEEEWKTYDDWKLSCFIWQCNDFFPKWLKEQLGPDKIIVRRFEDLLSDTRQIQEMIHFIDPEITIEEKILQKRQQQDINRKIDGDRRPEYLWSTWNDYEKSQFIEICGSVMQYYGYGIPD